MAPPVGGVLGTLPGNEEKPLPVEAQGVPLPGLAGNHHGVQPKIRQLGGDFFDVVHGKTFLTKIITPITNHPEAQQYHNSTSKSVKNHTTIPKLIDALREQNHKQTGKYDQPSKHDIRNHGCASLSSTSF